MRNMKAIVPIILGCMASVSGCKEPPPSSLLHSPRFYANPPGYVVYGFDNKQGLPCVIWPVKAPGVPHPPLFGAIRIVQNDQQLTLIAPDFKLEIGNAGERSFVLLGPMVPASEEVAGPQEK